MKRYHPSIYEWINRNTVVSSGPATLTVNASERCNLECFMCDYNAEKTVDLRLNIENIDPFLQKAERVYITGGEPFWFNDKVNKTAGKLFKKITNGFPRLKVNVYTNGILFNEEKAKLALRRFEAVHFSVDSLDPHIFEKVCGKPVLDRALKNIEALKRLKEKAGRGPHDEPYIHINTIVMKSTFDSLPAVALRLAELGGHKHHLLKLMALNGPNDPAMLKREMFSPAQAPKTSIERVKKELEKIYSENGIEVQDMAHVFCNGMPELPKPGAINEACPHPWTCAHILTNGDVHFCCVNVTVLGNINENCFDEIWNGKIAQDIRASFKRGEMKGCVQDNCPALVDYFAVNEGSYLKDLLSNIKSSFDRPDKVESTLFLRTAQMHQSHMAARTLLKRFPDAKFFVISSDRSARECMEWGIGARVMPYPGDFFHAETFMKWWRRNSPQEEYSLAAAVYNTDDRRGYEDVEQIMRSIKARRRIGVKPNGELVDF